MNIIPKFLKGGGFDSLFTLYTPIQTPNLQTPITKESASKKSDDEEKGKLTEKDLFNMIKEIDGLPNEMSALVSNLINTFKLSSISGFNANDLTTTYLLNLYQLKIVSLNKKKYDEALKSAKENGSMAEPAISMDGKLVVQTLNGVDTVTLLQYQKSNGLYKVLSVSQLANLRAYQPSLNNNLEIFNIINNSMGYESFQDLLKKGLTSLGSTEIDRNNMNPLSKEAALGLKMLGQLTEEQRIAVLSGSIEGTRITKELKKLAEALVTYLATLFPDRAKTWAAYKLGISNKNEATAKLIGMNLASTLSNKDSLIYDYNSFYNKNKGILDAQRESAKETDSKEKMTFLTGVQNGYGGRYEEVTLNLGGQADFKVTGTSYGAIADLNGTPIADATLSEVLTKSGLSGISNTLSVWFGDLLISPALFNKIAITNGGGVRVILPVKPGTKGRPDFELMNSFNALVQEVNNELGSNAKYEDRLALLEKKIASKLELSSLLTVTGKLDESKFLPYFVVQGLASDANFDFVDPKSNKLLAETKNKADTDYFKTVTKSDDYDADDNIFGDMFGLYDHVYKSDIFIPISTHNRLAAIIFSGQKIPDSRAMQILLESNSWDRDLNVSYSTNLLGI